LSFKLHRAPAGLGAGPLRRAGPVPVQPV